MKYSIVFPVYKNELNIPDLVDVCGMLRNTLVPEQTEFVFVVDGSPDASYLVLKDLLGKRDLQSQLISLSRNFGSFAAIQQGLLYAKGEYIGIMAADLQEPPEFILNAFQSLSKKEADIIIAQRVGREDGFLSNLLSSIFWSLYRKIIPEMPPGGVDIFACTKEVANKLTSFPEANTSLIGQLYWIGFRKKNIPYKRSKRKVGKSSWTLKKKIKYLLDSVYNFTDLPLKLSLGLGLLGTFLSGVLGMALVILRLQGLIRIEGYVAIMLTIMFFGSLNLVGLGILGEYLHRAFDNTKMRPRAIVMSHEQYGPSMQRD